MTRPDTIDAVVRTRSLRDGHFRAGRRHQAEAVDWPAGTFTETGLARLFDDPDLETEVLPDFAFGDEDPGQDGQDGGWSLP